MLTNSRFGGTCLVAVLTYIALCLGWRTGEIADDPGVGWHVKAGQLIITSGAVPQYDPFLALPIKPFGEISPSDARPWVADQWLSDVAWFQLLQLGNWPLVYVVCAGLYSLAFWGFASPAARKLGAGAIPVLISTLLAWKASQIHFIVRPVLVSIVLFSCVHARVRTLASRSISTIPGVLRELIVLVPVFAVWANLHPAFILGLTVLGILVLIEIVEQCWRHGCFLAGLSTKVGSFGKAAGLVCVLFACVAATLVNPYGLRLYKSIVRLGSSSYFLSLNSEWLPLRLASLEGYLFICLSILPLAVILSARGVRERLARFDCALVFVFGVQTLTMVRFLPYAAIASIPLCASALEMLGRLKLPTAFDLTRRWCAAISIFESSKANSRGAAVVAAFLGVIWIGIFGQIPGRPNCGPSVVRYPPAMMDVFKGDAPSGVIVASPNWGGNITSALFPRYRAVLDDRNTVVGEDLYRLYFRALGDVRELRKLILLFGATHVILPREAAIMNQLSRTEFWPILYEDGRNVVVKVSETVK